MEVQPGNIAPQKDLVLEGRYIRLQPLDPESDLDELYSASHGTEEKEAVWRYLFTGPYKSKDEFLAYLTNLKKNSDFVAFTVVDKNSSQKIGIINYMSIEPVHRSIEIGGIWYTPSFHKTYANTESSYLLIKYAFEVMHYRRMEWKCNNDNEKSKNAALKLGFTYEGLFRQHRVIKNRNRDTAWFSIIDSEWNDIKAKLEKSINR